MLIYMVRHGRTDWNDDRRIMGRRPVPLNERGVSMVEHLADHLSGEGIGTVYTGTLERARQTAGILAGAWGARIVEDAGLDESSYEGWVGMRYTELEGDPEFHLYRTSPTRSRFSDGEGMKDIQERGLAVIERIRAGREGKTALVSHSDVIKPIVAHFLGMDLDRMHRIAVANASVTLLDLVGVGEPRIRYMNVMPWKWRTGEIDRPGEHRRPGGEDVPGLSRRGGGEEA